MREKHAPFGLRLLELPTRCLSDTGIGADGSVSAFVFVMEKNDATEAVDGLTEKALHALRFLGAAATDQWLLTSTLQANQIYRPSLELLRRRALVEVRQQIQVDGHSQPGFRLTDLGRRVLRLTDQR